MKVSQAWNVSQSHWRLTNSPQQFTSLFVCPKRIKRVFLCVSHVMIACLSSSAQVKKFPHSCSLKTVHLWNSLGANFRTYGRCSIVSQPNFAPSLLCHVRLGIFMEENHTVAEKASSLALSTISHVTRRTSKQDQFSKWVTMLKFHGCAHSMHVPRLTRPWS